MTTPHSAAYRKYINSREWAARREIALALADNRCEVCGWDVPPLEVHHITYDRMGAERNADLLVVCPSCHKIEDAKRKTQVASSRWNTRLDAWATRRYGEDWQAFKDARDVDEEFRDWLEWGNEA